MPPEYFYPLLAVGFLVSMGVLRTLRVLVSHRVRLPAAEAPTDGRVADLEARVAELEERIDFAERLLTRGREDRADA